MDAPQPHPTSRGATGDQRPLRHSLLAFGAALLAGALVWGAWLGWDRTASYDVVTGTVQYPYVTLQVLGCALCVGVVVALFAARRFPLTGAGGVAAGFWAAWTVDAAATDDTGLFAVGALLLGMGLVVGTAAAAGVGLGAAALVRASRRRRSPLSG